MNFPPKVYNPKYFYFSFGKTDNPETANEFAESPSVTIKIHWSDYLLPAYYASCNFNIECKDFLFPLTISLSFFLCESIIYLIY